LRPLKGADAALHVVPEYLTLSSRSLRHSSAIICGVGYQGGSRVAIGDECCVHIYSDSSDFVA
jgi:hypothetical protein